MIELSRRARQIGGGAAQGSASQAAKPNIRPRPGVRPPSGQFGERRSNPSQRRRASEDIESLTEVVTASIAFGGLESGQLPDPVRVSEQGLVVRAPHRPPARRPRISARADARNQWSRSASEVGKIVSHKNEHQNSSEVIIIRLEKR